MKGLTLRQLKAALAERGVVISYSRLRTYCLAGLVPFERGTTGWKSIQVNPDQLQRMEAVIKLKDLGWTHEKVKEFLANPNASRWMKRPILPYSRIVEKFSA